MGTATISFGPKLGLLNNAAIQQIYYDQMRQFLQALDQLIMGSVINATSVSPPTSPSNGDAYLLIGGTPGGAWTGQAGKIAVWDTQVTNTGTNTLNPSWVFYTPKAGWTLWNVAASSYTVYNGSAWTAVGGGGANFPTNTDITSLTGIPNTNIDTTGYSFGPGAFSTGNIVQIANQAWTGTPVTGYGIGISSSSDSTIVSAGFIGTSGTLSANQVTSLGNVTVSGDVQIGSGTANTYGVIVPRGSSNVGIKISGQGITTLPVSISLVSGTSAPTSGVGLVGFDANYFTQTTVGSAGGASALPVTPRGYLQFVDPTGTVCVFAYYAAS